VTFIVEFHFQHEIYNGPMSSSFVKIIFFLSHDTDNDAVHMELLSALHAVPVCM